jgi:hypothetical protein
VKAASCATRMAGVSCSTTSRRIIAARRPTTRRRLALHPGDRDARRPELLTRDHVARCIMQEVVRAGAVPTAAWPSTSVDRRSPQRRRAHQEKLPSMYHQFMQLAGIDITTTPMEVGPTTHYVMGGVRVDPDSQMSTVPGLFAAGECAAGLHGANRLGGNSLSDLLVFGKRAGEHAAAFARSHSVGKVNAGQVDEAARRAVAPFERDGSGHEAPYQVQHELQDMMQDLVGIVRNERTCCRPRRSGAPQSTGRSGWCRRKSGVQSGLAYALNWRISSPCPRRSPARRSPGRRAAVGTSGGFPGEGSGVCQVQYRCAEGAGRRDAGVRRAFATCLTSSAVIKEMG